MSLRNNVHTHGPFLDVPTSLAKHSARTSAVNNPRIRVTGSAAGSAEVGMTCRSTGCEYPPRLTKQPVRWHAWDSLRLQARVSLHLGLWWAGRCFKRTADAWKRTLRAFMEALRLLTQDLKAL